MLWTMSSLVQIMGHSLCGTKILPVFKTRSEPCRTEAILSTVRHLFWRLYYLKQCWLNYHLDFHDQTSLKLFKKITWNCKISEILFRPHCINPLRLSDTYIVSVNLPSLVQIMACCLVSTKPLSKPVLGYCQLVPYEQTSVKLWSKYKTFHSRRCRVRNFTRPIVWDE